MRNPSSDHLVLSSNITRKSETAKGYCSTRVNGMTIEGGNNYFSKVHVLFLPPPPACP